MTRHLLTGATGVVGGAIALELLAETADEVVCLVRAPDADAARARLHGTLATAARAYGREELLAEIPRARAIPGDVLEPLCGLDEPPAADLVWHAAASLKFYDRDADEINATNIEGTRNALELGRRAAAFNHVSTAFVAGARRGTIHEHVAAPDVPVNNVYEASKVAAEQLVDAAHGEALATRILRPSVVVGHSETLATLSDTGLYGALREWIRFRRKVSEKLGAYLSHYRTQLLGEPDTEINFIPIDRVARNAVRVGTADTAARVFHLTNETGVTALETTSACFEVLGMSEPQLTSTPATFSSLDRALNDEGPFYTGYLRNGKRFDLANTSAVCGPDASRWPCDRTTILRLLEWYVEHRVGGAAAPVGPAAAAEVARG